MKSDWERSAGMLAEPNRGGRLFVVNTKVGDEARKRLSLATIKGTTVAVGTAFP